ncbi:10600_t:CDS:2 [Gigaspora rosea]|nr:10600_t:CDS:2 [Gigaspora rosea]
MYSSSRSVEHDRSVSPQYSEKRSRSLLCGQRSSNQNQLCDNDNGQTQLQQPLSFQNRSCNDNGSRNSF